MSNKVIDAGEKAAEAEVQLAISQIRLLQNELEVATSTLIPIVREYLKELTSIRMAFAREVQDILRSAREISGLTKTTEELRAFAINLAMLKEVMDSGILDKIKGIIK